MDEFASEGKDDHAMGDYAGTRRHRRRPDLDVLETRGLLSGLVGGGWGQPTPLPPVPPSNMTGHVAVETVIGTTADDAADDRAALAGDELADPAVREILALGLTEEDAAEASVTGDPSGRMPGTSGTVALPPVPFGIDQNSSAAGLVFDQSVNTPGDGETPGGLVNSAPAGPSTATGVATREARWGQDRSSPARHGVGIPDTAGVGPATAAGELAPGGVPFAPPRGDGLISRLPQFGRSAIEEAFNRWFARVERIGAIDGSRGPNTTQLWSLSLAAAVVAGIGLARRVRRGEGARAVERRGEGRRGSFLEFPVAWSSRTP